MLGWQLQGKESSQSLSLPPSRAAARASQWKSFLVNASAAGGQQLSSARGGDCSLEAPTPPPQRLLSPSGVLLQVQQEDALTTWGGFPPRPETSPSLTTHSSLSPKHSLGEECGKSAPLAALPEQRAPEARSRPRGPSRERVLGSPAHSRFPGPPARPLPSRLCLGARPPHHPARSRTRTPRPAALGAVMAARSSFSRHGGSPARRGPAISGSSILGHRSSTSRGVASACSSCFCKG